MTITIKGLSRMAAMLFSTCCLDATAALADDSMPQTREAALAMEAKDALPLTPFYDPLVPLPAASPGTLIWSEPAEGYDLPTGAHAVRILYHSRALDGHDVAASGVVLLPAGEPPAGGWPVIAWAHGTIGVARFCAPSLMKDVAYGDEGLMPMVAAGFAVVAPDYAGLGAPGPYQYDDKIPQANDVVYAVPAAHTAVPALGRRWVAIGHSQGGVAVWGVAELEAKLKEPDYVGGISVAGDMDYDAFMTYDAAVADPEGALYWPLWASGIKASYPSFNVAKMLTPPALARYQDVTTRGCWYHAYAVMKEIGHQPATRPGWQAAPEVRRFNHDSYSGDKPIEGPLMVLAGDDDKAVAIANIRRSVAQACARGLELEFVHRPGLDHDPLMEKTILEQLAWARDRLAGKPWHGNCGV